MAQARKTVVLSMTLYGFYTREVVAGVLRYVRENRRWDIRVVPQLDEDLESSWLWGKHQADGAILSMDSPRRAKLAHRLRMPVVNTDDAVEPQGVPTVICDNRQAGRLVARHFMDRGFKNFGFVDNGHYYSRTRLEGFSEELGRHGLACDVLRHPAGKALGYLDIDRSLMAAWLRKRPKPLAVMLCHDMYGMHMINLCNDIGLRVPDDIAAVGVDNDELFCSGCQQPLSSVNMPNRQVGYEAASLLDRLMNGHKPPTTPVLLAPPDVVVRHSSDTVGTHDDVIRQAMHFIRFHASQRIGVPDVVRAVSVCRSILNRRFRAVLGRSPAKEILRNRLELAKSLLAETEIKMEGVATRSGFSGQRVFYRLFVHDTGIAPIEYRKRARHATS